MRVILAVVLFLAGIVMGIALHHHYKPAPKPKHDRVIRPM